MLHQRVMIGFRAILGLGLVLEVYEAQWMNAALALGILVLTLLPSVLARDLDLFIPPELEILAIGFVFAAVFLGETHDYYGRFWWWDILLHATSGGLLGVFGFLLVFVLSANPRIDLHMRPGFVALFAFCFSVAVGTIWEIFEFAMDEIVGTTMQKPMFDDPSGLTDTMWDLIVDVAGAFLVAVLGYRSMSREGDSFVQRWIQSFVDRNPRLFPDREGASKDAS